MPSTIIHTGRCKTCGKNAPPAKAVDVASPVHISGGKEGDTEFSFCQCPDCGTLWMKTRDIGGTGGSGSFHKRVTEGSF
jgi:hypothetical protein